MMKRCVDDQQKKMLEVIEFSVYIFVGSDKN